MAYQAKALRMLNGNTYEFIGKTWWGVCNTAQSTQAKTVSITGFTPDDLTVGTKIIVQFTYSQSYNGTPTLNVNNTRAIQMLSASGTTAMRYEWSAGAVLELVYNGTYWVIVGGGHANTAQYGKTILASYMTGDWRDNASIAATPRTVVSSIDSLYGRQFLGGDGDSFYYKFLDTTTPSTWVDNAVVFTDLFLTPINNDAFSNRLFKITYGDIVRYAPLPWLSSDNSYFLPFYSEEGEGIYELLGMEYDVIAKTIKVIATEGLQGAYPFKVEFFYNHSAGFVPYPVFQDTVGDIETLLASI